MNRSIALVGGGATALSFLNAYIKKYKNDGNLPDSIFVFEKRGIFGPGVAYEDDLVTNLLNTKTGFITPFSDRPGDFHTWLCERPEEWYNQFPSFVVDADSYAPRSLFGLYLRSRFNWLVKQAAVAGIRVIQLHAEVVDIFPVARSYAIVTSCNVTVHADHVVLAVGTIQRGGNEKGSREKGVFSNPYPLEALSKAVHKDASVAILGARLSCIDSVVGLISQGHRGPITIHSRSGYFPAVRGCQGRIIPQILTADKARDLAQSGSRMGLKDLAHLFLQELRLQDTPSVSIENLQPPADFMTYLRSEIEASRHPRPWQAVLYATNGFIEDLWSALEPADQKRLMNDLFSVFMSYRVSFPPVNAQLLLNYAEAGQIDFVPGGFSIAEDFDRNALIMADGTLREYDCLVWATGAPRSINELDSQIIKNLAARRMITPHMMGGVQVDPSSYRAIEPTGEMANSLRIVGELTNGQFFFTSALEILVRQAGRCAESLVQDILMANDDVVEHATATSLVAC